MLPPASKSKGIIDIRWKERKLSNHPHFINGVTGLSHFSILITLLFCTDWKSFSQQQQQKKALIKDVIRKWNMDWLAERIKIRFS